MGALVRPRAAECSFNWVFSLKKRSDPQRQNTRDPPGIRQGSARDHTFGAHARRDAQDRMHGTRTVQGEGKMTGSNYPNLSTRPVNLLEVSHYVTSSVFLDHSESDGIIGVEIHEILILDIET